MSNTGSASVTVGPGLPTLLTVLFVALKLTGVITWSWLWVLSPLWIGFALFAVFGLLFLIIAGIAVLFQDRRDKKKIARRRARGDLGYRRPTNYR